MLSDLADLGGLTTSLVHDDPERNLSALADRIDANATRLLERAAKAASAGGSDETYSWVVQGVRLPVAELLCHSLNEALVHGFDLAQASDQTWVIERRHAALVCSGFLVPVINQLDPRTLIDQKAGAGLRACYDVRLRSGDQAYFIVDNGTLSVGTPSANKHRKVDCHLLADPAALLLVLWGRIGKLKPILKGQLVAWGRRPWLAFALTRVARLP